MVSICETVIESYRSTLGRKFTSHASGDSCIVVSPFQRADGESIEVEASLSPDGTLRLSDMGESIAFLYVNGLTVSRGVLDAARKICRRYNVEISRSELIANSPATEELGTRLHDLLQASIVVSDLIQRRRPSDIVQFPDMVEGLLVANRIVYDSDVHIAGKVQEHRVTFLIERDEAPIVVQPISAASEGAAFSWAERWAFRFTDIRDANERIETVAVLDDRGSRSSLWTPRVMAPLVSRSTVVRWSSNESLLGFFNAA